MSPPLRLMSHNRQWLQEFQQSKSLLLWAAEGWIREIEHIGSTSMPDGVAQPVIDMLAGMQELRGLNEAAALIEGLNYVRVASPDWCADELTAWLHKPRVGEITHSVLLVRLGGRAWQRALQIRHWLHEHQSDWQYFQTLKREHFTAECDAADRYAAAKTVFFQTLEEHTK